MKPITNSIKIKVLTLYAISLLVFGFLMSTPSEILIGLKNILTQPDTLITDYIGIGGMGASFVNSGLLTLIFVFMIYKLKINVSGVTIASLFTIAGFAFFGKNLLNVWFIILGVYLYARYQKEKFTKYVYIALFGTALAPLVTEVMFSSVLLPNLRILLAALIGISAGFILPPLSTFLLRVHQGYNLYNIGFTAGIIGTIFISVFKSYGFLPAPRLIWTTGNNTVLGIYLAVTFISMIALGYILDKEAFKKFRNIIEYPGRLVEDFVFLEGFGATLVNMGINGLLATSYIVLVGGAINGPTIAGVLTIVGFSAFGKHCVNILPIFLGVLLGSITKVWAINEPAILLAALFGTGLAPIAGEYGWFYGILAGFIHSSVVLNVGVLHAGTNLYNNGFSAGLVAAFLVPIINAFRKEDA